MKNRDEPSPENNSSMKAQGKKLSVNGKTLNKNSNKILWVVLAVLVMGLISFIAANNDTFHLSISSTVAPSSCGTARNLSANDIQHGVNAYSSNCRTQTKEQQDEKRWQDILEASPVVIAASSVVTALSLILLTWQVSRLVKTLSKR